MKKWFLADNSATVDQILMIFFGRPQWNFKSDKWWKNQPSSTSASYAKHNKPSAPTYNRLIDNHTTGYLNLRKRYLAYLCNHVGYGMDPNSTSCCCPHCPQLDPCRPHLIWSCFFFLRPICEKFDNSLHQYFPREGASGRCLGGDPSQMWNHMDSGDQSLQQIL